MLNRVELVGRVTRDADVRPSPEPMMAQFVLAVDRDRANSNDDRDADFVRCIAGSALLPLATLVCVRGRLVAVEGRLESRYDEAADGTRRRVTDVVAERLWALS